MTVVSSWFRARKKPLFPSWSKAFLVRMSLWSQSFPLFLRWKGAPEHCFDLRRAIHLAQAAPRRI
ncbi:hypothetical protein MPNT_110010 [Candidatus Methylacidithermus pantelleriae]|uniref:Uncharacterized protein n=1 Tax=Candidatus Methylacidithermus pantelleriae TaxID=2744239 RepID=A0A8J2BMV7_9BACT|nr:hypothetical protein MPNT_110010 [Candidatus Methylacidithermus pantelleriae]